MSGNNTNDNATKKSKKVNKLETETQNTLRVGLHVLMKCVTWLLLNVNVYLSFV